MLAAPPIQCPRTPAEWAAYYQLRYAVLRQPWQQPPGSERVPADEEADTMHALLLAKGNDALPVALAVGMLQRIGTQQAQIRFMAVAPAAAGTGLGRRVVAYLEQEARADGLTEIVLHARETAVTFYATLNYELVAPSHTLFGVLPHFLMRKPL